MQPHHIHMWSDQQLHQNSRISEANSGHRKVSSQVGRQSDPNFVVEKLSRGTSESQNAKGKKSQQFEMTIQENLRDSPEVHKKAQQE